MKLVTLLCAIFAISFLTRPGYPASVSFGPAAGSGACDCSATPRKPSRKDATPICEFTRMNEMCEYAGEDTMELYFFLLFR
jgi:hypothetical protein